MVLVKAKRDEILGPLSAVSGIIERRHTLPILSNVLIERVGGKLSFLATDIEIQITAKSGLEAAAESHSITVGARKLRRDTGVEFSDEWLRKYVVNRPVSAA